MFTTEGALLRPVLREVGSHITSLAPAIQPNWLSPPSLAHSFPHNCLHISRVPGDRPFPCAEAAMCVDGQNPFVQKFPLCLVSLAILPLGFQYEKFTGFEPDNKIRTIFSDNAVRDYLLPLSSLHLEEGLNFIVFCFLRRQTHNSANALIPQSPSYAPVT